MTADISETGTRLGTSADARRAHVAPLLAAGLSVRAIARQTGIPVSAVHRAKCQINKATAGQDAVEPSNYVTRRTIDGVPHDVRHLTIEVYEHKVSEAIGRGLLHPDKRDDPGTVVSALFAACFTDDTLHWLCRRRFVEWNERGKAEAIIADLTELHWFPSGKRRMATRFCSLYVHC